MGKNARRRKEHQYIEKYGELPKEPRKVAWGRLILGLVIILAIIFGVKFGYKENKTMIATISTTMGEIKLELFKDDAPKTVENFQKLAEKGYYNGVIFHRVIKDFMIQGGDPTGSGTGGESAFGKEFEDEINQHKIEAGSLAMANRGPNTNGSQFFIVTEKPQPHLDGKHTVFGKVVEGTDVVKKIAAVQVGENNKPLQDVKMTGVKIEEK